MTRSTIFACFMSASAIALSLPVQAEAIRDLPLDQPESFLSILYI